MPNYCQSNLEVSGLTSNEVTELATLIEKEALLSTLVPRPTEEELPYSAGTMTREEALDHGPNSPWWDAKTPEQQEKWLDQFATAQETEERIARFGVKDGYTWCLNHWGTKWDIFESDINHKGEDNLNATFTTAWSPPIQGIERVSALFPNATFLLQYSEPGMDFHGVAAFRNGETAVADGTSPTTLWQEWAEQNHPEDFSLYLKAMNDELGEDEQEVDEWEIQERLESAYYDTGAPQRYIAELREQVLTSIS